MKGAKIRWFTQVLGWIAVMGWASFPNGLALTKLGLDRIALMGWIVDSPHETWAG